MNGAEVVTEVLARSRMTKSELCVRAGVSRSLLDDYLKGRVQPSIVRVAALAQAGGLELEIRLEEPPPPLPDSFVAVLEFGDLFPRNDHKPLVNLGPVWRQAARRRTDG